MTTRTGTVPDPVETEEKVMSAVNTTGLKKVFSCGAAAVVMSAILTGVFLQSANTPPASAFEPAVQQAGQSGLQLAQADLTVLLD